MIVAAAVVFVVSDLLPFVVSELLPGLAILRSLLLGGSLIVWLLDLAPQDIKVAKGEGGALPDAASVLKLIKSRRSVFCKDMQYPPAPLASSDLALLLEAANWAPSHSRTDPWRFVVLSSDQSELVHVTVNSRARLAQPA